MSPKPDKPDKPDKRDKAPKQLIPLPTGLVAYEEDLIIKTVPPRPMQMIEMTVIGNCRVKTLSPNLRIVKR